MKPLLIALTVVIGWLLIARSPVGLRIGNEARALSDRVVLGILQVTSEFETEV